MTTYWDRKLMKSHDELASLQKVLQKYGGTGSLLKKKIKEVRKYHNSTLAHIKQMDAPNKFASMTEDEIISEVTNTLNLDSLKSAFNESQEEEDK